MRNLTCHNHDGNFSICHNTLSRVLVETTNFTALKTFVLFNNDDTEKLRHVWLQDLSLRGVGTICSHCLIRLFLICVYSSALCVPTLICCQRKKCLWSKFVFIIHGISTTCNKLHIYCPPPYRSCIGIVLCTTRTLHHIA